MAKEVVVTHDGITLSIQGAPDVVGRVGQRFPLDSLSETQQQQIEDKDPWLLDHVEVSSSSSSSSGGGSGKGEKYDPSANNVAEVKSYLDGANAAERKRVVAAEKKDKGRKGILDYEPSEDKSSGGVAGGQPVPGYDDLDTGQVVALLEGNSKDDEFISKVQAYEKSNEGRAQILEYVPAEKSGGNEG